MTKLRWDRAGIRQHDPGTVTILTEQTRPDPWVPPQERARRKAENAEATARLLQRSERIRYKAMIKKYGVQKAVTLGVPEAFLASLLEAKLLAQHREARAREKRERRAARRKARLKTT